MSLLNVFKKTPVRAMGGVVERFGPYFGTGVVQGYSVLLQGEAEAFTVLRDYQNTDEPVGLTQAGDEVSLAVDDRGVVKLSSFRNYTLAARLGRNT